MCIKLYNMAEIINILLYNFTLIKKKAQSEKISDIHTIL